MEETDKIDDKQIEGFNHGYVLAEYAPQLAKKLLKIEAVSPHIKGLQHGINQYTNEQIKDKRPSFLKENRITVDKSDLDRNKSKNRGIEPER